MNVFDGKGLQNLYQPKKNSNGEDNGQITIIGGSKLFHGAPLFSLKTASRIVDMVFFATPEKSVGYVAEKIKSQLLSFIWIPWEEVEEYIQKSDAILIGPGFMRYSSESDGHKYDTEFCDDECKQTREITKQFLTKYSKKKWVIDAGSLQTMEDIWIPEGAIITPNRKEFEILFKIKGGKGKKKITELVSKMAKNYKCTIVLKGPETIVCSPDDCMVVKGGNPGLTKGGTGDVLAGLTTALFAKNDAFLSALAASYVQKKAADVIYKDKGPYYNSDDLADFIPDVLFKEVKN